MRTTPKFLLFVLFALTSTVASAQFSLGLRAGFNWANISESQAIDNLTPDFKYIDNYNYALVAEIPVTENIAFQPELALIKKGFALNEGLDINLLGIDIPLGASAESRFSYVEVPLLAKFKTGGEYISAYAIAGPTVGYATGGKLVTKANVLIEFDIAETDIDLDAVDMNRFELGGVVGAGLALNIGSGQAFVDARYQMGFTPVHDLSVLDERVTNTGFGVNVGFMVPIGN